MGRPALTTIRLHAPDFIHIPQSAWEAIGSPARVSFMFNQEPRAIGILPPKPNAASYAVWSTATRTKSVHAAALFRYMGIRPDTLPMVRPVVIDDGMIVIELDDTE